MLGVVLLLGVAATQIGLAFWDASVWKTDGPARVLRRARVALWTVSILAIPVIAVQLIEMVDYWIETGPPRTAVQAYGVVGVALLVHLVFRLGASIVLRKDRLVAAGWTALGAAVLMIALTGFRDVPFPSVQFLLLVVAFLAVASVFAPAAAAAWETRSRRLVVPGIVLALLFLPQAIFAVPAAVPLTLLFNVGPAEHLWSVEIKPDDRAAAYQMEVPFLVPRGTAAEQNSDPGELANPSRDARILTPLGKSLSVTAGTAELRWDQTTGLLHVTGTGVTRIDAAHRFYGSTEHREGFFDLARPSDEVVMRSATGAANVTWTFDMGGGTGHTCWQEYTLSVRVPSAGNATLEGDDESAMCA